MSVVSEGVLKEYDPEKPFKCGSPSNSGKKEFMDFSYEEAAISHLAFRQAKKLDEKNYNLILYSQLPEEKLVKLDFLPPVSSFPIANKKTVSLLKEFCPNDFQALPVCVKNHPDAKKIESFSNSDYFLINILFLSDTIDHEQSKFEGFADPRLVGEIRGIRKLVFKKDAMSGHHLVREIKYKGLMVASRDLAIFLNKHKIRGIELYPDYDAYSL